MSERTVAAGEPDRPASAPTSEFISLAEEFDRFYLREYPKMVALAFALSGNRWAAEEIAQEALIRAHRNWRRIVGYDKPGAWLRRVTVNLATSFLRRRITEARALSRIAFGRAEALPPPPNDGGIWAAVAALPRRQRQVVGLHYLDQLPIAEIAAVLELKESTVKTHLRRGRETLGRSLGEEPPP